MAMPKNDKEWNRRLWMGVAVIVLVTVAYYTDRLGPGTYTGDWKEYALIIGGTFAFLGGYITITDIVDRIVGKKK